MHKSGTTLLSEILHKSDINMVDNNQSKGYYEGNKMERRTCVDINHQILQSREQHSLNIKAYRKDLKLTPDLITKITRIIDDCVAKYTDWGFKDPRTCITYPLWEKYLPEHKLIIVYRDPGKVVNHYSKKFHPLKKAFRAVKTLNQWKQHNLLLLGILDRSKHPCLVISYEDLLLDDRLLEGLSKFLGKTVYDARIKSKTSNKRNMPIPWLRFMDMFSSGSTMRILKRLESKKSQV